MSRYITLQQPKGYRGLPGRNKPKLQAVLRRDSVRSERGDAQILAATVRTDDPLPVLLGIVEHHQRCEFRRAGGIPRYRANGGDAAATIQPR